MKSLKQTSLLFLGGILAGSLLLQSCQKEVPKTTKGNASGITYMKKANAISNQSLQLASVALKSAGVKGFFRTAAPIDSIECANLIYDTLGVQRSVLIDFGTGCTNSDGNFLAGSILVEYEANNQVDIDLSNTKLTLTLTNFVSQNSRQTGTINVHNKGINGSGNVEASLAMNMQTTDLLNSEVLNVIFNLDIEDTPSEIHQNGSMNVVDGNGNTIQVDVTETLWEGKSVGCQGLYTHGKMFITTTGDPDKLIEYGDGTCDDIGHETVSGVKTRFTVTAN